ncbi:hypothetical protein QQF64_034061 [Cirrhinus molitorella]|uniref:Uncharacterized protein n=1 Tax=Cirrhinus molitorella TaxID=172907 RepID=A0ABR3MVM6_9TELE
MLLPATTIQAIIEEFQEVHDTGMKYALSKIHDKLAILNLQDSEISQILEDVSKEDLFKECHKGPMKSDHTRKSFFKKTFNYIEPTKIYLGADEAGRERYFQYVPIKETLKSLLSQSVVKDQYRETKMKQSNSQPSVLTDVLDGKTFKDNTLLNESPHLCL